MTLHLRLYQYVVLIISNNTEFQDWSNNDCCQSHQEVYVHPLRTRKVYIPGNGHVQNSRAVEWRSKRGWKNIVSNGLHSNCIHFCKTRARSFNIGSGLLSKPPWRIFKLGSPHLTALSYLGSGILPRSYLWLLLVYTVNLLTMERISVGPSRWLDLSIGCRVQFCISGAINCSSQRFKWGATWSGLHIFLITWQGDTLISCRSLYCIVGLSPLLFNISQASHHLRDTHGQTKRR